MPFHFGMDDSNVGKIQCTVTQQLNELLMHKVSLHFLIQVIISSVWDSVLELQYQFRLLDLN